MKNCCPICNTPVNDSWLSWGSYKEIYTCNTCRSQIGWSNRWISIEFYKPFVALIFMNALFHIIPRENSLPSLSLAGIVCFIFMLRGLMPLQRFFVIRERGDKSE